MWVQMREPSSSLGNDESLLELPFVKVRRQLIRTRMEDADHSSSCTWDLLRRSLILSLQRMEGVHGLRPLARAFSNSFSMRTFVRSSAFPLVINELMFGRTIEVNDLQFSIMRDGRDAQVIKTIYMATVYSISLRKLQAWLIIPEQTSCPQASKRPLPSMKTDGRLVLATHEMQIHKETHDLRMQDMLRLAHQLRLRSQTVLLVLVTSIYRKWSV